MPSLFVGALIAAVALVAAIPHHLCTEEVRLQLNQTSTPAVLSSAQAVQVKVFSNGSTFFSLNMENIEPEFLELRAFLQENTFFADKNASTFQNKPQKVIFRGYLNTSNPELIESIVVADKPKLLVRVRTAEGLSMRARIPKDLRFNFQIDRKPTSQGRSLFLVFVVAGCLAVLLTLTVIAWTVVRHRRTSKYYSWPNDGTEWFEPTVKPIQTEQYLATRRSPTTQTER